MKNTFGNSLTVTVFGESHGNSIGAVIDGLPSGIKVDREFIRHQLSLRRPQGSISTARSEKDEFQILSGVFKEFTTGTPLCIDIPNLDTRSGDYEQTAMLARPSHADYTAHCKYGGFEDYRGGGHFSGRITAAIVAAGAIVIPALKKKRIEICTHIKRLAGVEDTPFSDFKAQFKYLADKNFPVIDSTAEEKMINRITAAKAEGDSVGGVLETAVIGLEAGLGEPYFDTVEGILSHALYSVPAVKGVEFGAGFAISEMKGSAANDSFYTENGRILTETNNSGGINGGITNGMPVIFRSAVKPTPSIGIKQKTVDIKNNKNAELLIKGRHDPCIVHRAAVVVNSVTALAVCDLLTMRHGTEWAK